MEIKSGIRPGYRILNLDFTEIPQQASLRADRDRGQAPVNNIYSAGLASVDKNGSPAEILPWYDGLNNEPEYLIKIVTDNPVALGLLFTKAQIQHGTGLGLYTLEAGELRRLPRESWPEEILNFFEYNDLNGWAMGSMLDEALLGNFFSQLIFSKGSSLSPKKVVRVNRIDPTLVRALQPSKRRNDRAIKEYVLAETWKDLRTITGLKKIRAYNRRDFHNPNTLAFTPHQSKYAEILWHGKMSLPGFPVYVPPRWYGARKSGELQNEIPHWHIANIVNMWGIRMRVSVNEEYIQSKLNTINPDTGENYKEEEIKKEIRDKFQDYCTSPQNVGKVMLDTFYYDPGQKEPRRGFIIDHIKIDLSDEAYTKISALTNSAFTSAWGVNPNLADVITTKGMSSGSEQTQAWNIQNAKSSYPRAMILQLLKFIHDFNGWGKEYYWGFENPNLVTKDLSITGQAAGQVKAE